MDEQILFELTLATSSVAIIELGKNWIASKQEDHQDKAKGVFHLNEVFRSKDSEWAAFCYNHTGGFCMNSEVPEIDWLNIKKNLSGISFQLLNVRKIKTPHPDL